MTVVLSNGALGPQRVSSPARLRQKRREKTRREEEVRRCMFEEKKWTTFSNLSMEVEKTTCEKPKSRFLKSREATYGKIWVTAGNSGQWNAWLPPRDRYPCGDFY